MSDPQPVERVVRRHRGASSAPPRRLRWAVPVVLSVAGAGILAWWAATGPAVEVASGTAATQRVATPIASARRVPEWVTRTSAQRAAAADAAPTLSSLPETSCVLLRSNGRTIVEDGPDAPVIPASNLKLLTASAAVELLGADTRLHTSVVTAAPPANGVVNGDLFFVGGGDPVLSTDAYVPYEEHPRELLTSMEVLADRIVASGVRTVNGSVVGDESRYDTERAGPGWPSRYITDAQVSPLSALVVDDSRATPAALEGPKDPPASQPALHAADVLTRLLEQRGVNVSGAPRVGAAPGGSAEVAGIDSPTVAQLAEQLIRFSDNTTSELLVKEIGKRSSNAGTTGAGTAAVADWVRRSSLPSQVLELADGSGLSPDNRVSCALLVGLLERAGPDSAFASWLARPGQAGTLHDRMVGDELRERVRAKTGSLNNVRSLSGWLTPRSGQPVAFATVLNTAGPGADRGEEILTEQLLRSELGFPEVPGLGDLAPRAPRPA